MMIWWERKIVTITSVTATINFFVSTCSKRCASIQVFKRGNTGIYHQEGAPGCVSGVGEGWMFWGSHEQLVSESHFFFFFLKTDVIVANWSHSSVKQLFPDVNIILLFRCSLHCCVTERSWPSLGVTDQVNELLCDLPFPFDMELL